MCAIVISSFFDPASALIAAEKPVAMKPATAITMSRIAWIVDWKNANTRPRVASSTSSPTIVKPVGYAVPEMTPSRNTKIVTTARFGTSAIIASGTADAVSVTPNSRRREKSPNGRLPNPMPIASPIRIIAKTRLNPADPPFSVYVM